MPVSVQAAELFFSSPTVVQSEQIFTVDVLVDSQEQAFNAAEGEITFPTDVLEVLSVETKPSSTVFNFWLYLPQYSNEDGTISFSGGTTRGVLGADVKILSIKFKAKGGGEAIVSADKASINASDGSGTNILEQITAARINIVPAPVVVPERLYPVIESLPSPTPVETSAGVQEIMAEPEVVAELPVEALIEDEENVEELVECEVDLFSECALAYPYVTDVSTISRQDGATDILAFGIAPEGDHVHLRLSLNGVPYKEQIVIIQEGRDWETRLFNVTDYGIYDLQVWSEDMESVEKSEVYTWSNIKIHPPYTFFIGGKLFDWHILVTITLGVLLVLGRCLLWWSRKRQVNVCVVTGLAVGFMLLGVLFAASLIVSIWMWQRDYGQTTVSYWYNTHVVCLDYSHRKKEDFGSAHLAVMVDGVLQRVPSGVGISPVCIASVHTHDSTGNLHLRVKEGVSEVTVSDFLAIAGSEVAQEGYDYEVTINGRNYTDLTDVYKIQDGDRIVIDYTLANGSSAENTD